MQTLCDVFATYVDRCNRPDALAYQGQDGEPYVISSNEFKDRVLHFAIGLKKLGIKPERRLALISENRPEWQVVDFACQLLDAVLIPINPAGTAGDTARILGHGKPDYLVISGQVAAILQADKALTTPNRVIDLDAAKPHRDWLPFEDVLKMGREEDYTEFLNSAVASCQPHSVVTIQYDTGVESEPRGVTLSHADLVAVATACSSVLRIGPADRILCKGSFANPFFRVLSYLNFMHGSSLVYSRTNQLREITKTARPTVLAADLQFYHDLKLQIELASKHSAGLRRLMSRWSLAVAKKKARKGLAAAKPQPLKDPSRLLARMAFSDIWPPGIALPRILIAGGHLPAEDSNLLHSLGLRVLESFGSKQSCILTMNPPMMPKPGTVGVPLPGFSIRLSDDGEVLGKREQATVGYNNDQAQAQNAGVDGWFNCGVKGKLDEDGYLILDDAERSNAP